MPYQGFWGFPQEPFLLNQTQFSETYEELLVKIENYPRGIVFEVHKELVKTNIIPYEDVKWTWNIDRDCKWKVWAKCPEVLAHLWL